MWCGGGDGRRLLLFGSQRHVATAVVVINSVTNLHFSRPFGKLIWNIIYYIYTHKRDHIQLRHLYFYYHQFSVRYIHGRDNGKTLKLKRLIILLSSTYCNKIIIKLTTLISRWWFVCNDDTDFDAKYRGFENFTCIWKFRREDIF